MAIKNPNAILMQYILANASIMAAVSQRVYCPRIIDTDDLTYPFIVFRRIGGRGDSAAPVIHNPTIQMMYYAETEKAAQDLYQIVYEVLQGLSGASAEISSVDYYIKSIYENSGAVDLYDTELKRPYVQNFWSVSVVG